MTHLMKLATALIASACTFAGAFAQEVEAPPEGGEPRDYTLPKLETYTLRNGMKVTLVPYGRVPKAFVMATVQVGNINDGDTPWISDLTADMMGEGAGGKTASEMALAAAMMGGDVNIAVGLDQTTVSMDVLTESVSDAVELVADVLQHPTLPESEFERIQQNRLRNISIAATQPGSLAQDAFLKAIYPNHPYSNAVLPEAEAFAALTLEDAKTFHGENFGAQRTHLYVVGEFNRREVKRAISDSFRRWEKGPEALVLVPEQPDAPKVSLIDRPGAVQSTIRLGKRVPPVDQTIDLEAADTILGGYFSSRITRNIREDKGFTYSPNSAISIENGAAYWRQNADITSESTGPALAEIVKEIRGLQDAPPPAEELRGIKNYLNGIFVIQLASRNGVANRLAFVDLHDLGAEYLENYVSTVEALTPETIQQAAVSHLAVDEMSLAVAGDLASVRAQLEALPDFSERLPETE
ncbi:M16 family metallopeptidase [Hyphococcus sp.]|uniref:M16 family metallopeptidase n=1 Tax=Hyphococcus sp. TaxID=2038636 RepID=UPI003CCC4494